MTERYHNNPAEKQNLKKNVSSDNLLVLYNDDIHSFDYVIQSLMEVCDHTEIQAEQCTMITHYKGSCDVKKGSGEELREMQMRLIQKGLKAIIE